MEAIAYGIIFGVIFGCVFCWQVIEYIAAKNVETKAEKKENKWRAMSIQFLFDDGSTQESCIRLYDPNGESIYRMIENFNRHKDGYQGAYQLAQEDENGFTIVGATKKTIVGYKIIGG